MSDNEDGSMLGVLVFVVGLLAVGWAFGMMTENTNDAFWALPKNSIVECTTGQDLKLRETEGVAELRVTFKDGEYDQITCANIPTAAAAE